MRYQEPKYIRNDNSALRNKDIVNVTTSSDMCIFSRPTFDMSGTTKIPCNNLTCDFSGVSYTTLLDTTIETCFTDNKLSTTTCLDSFSWNVNIYEDGNLSYSGTFLTTTDFTDIPTDNELFDGISNAFDTLGYTYTKIDSEYTIQRPFSVDVLDINLEVQSNLLDTCTMTGSSECGCPSGYTVTVGNDDCFSGSTTAATSGATFYTIGAGSSDGAYGNSGAYFYEDITNKEYPIQNKNNGNPLVLVDGSNDPSPYPTNTYNPSGNTIGIQVGGINNSLWGTAGASIDGRLNDVGLWATVSPPANEFIGFSQCIDIPVGGTYHIALAADNYCRFKVNGELIVVIEHSSFLSYAYSKWHVFPITLNSGKNIIEMESADDGAVNAAFAAEIYSADTATLTGATMVSELGIVFSTSGLSGTFETGDNSGWSCPSGYALDTCSGGTPTCTKISRTNFEECDFSGSCTGDSSTLCTQVYDSIDSGSTGVYLISGDTDIDITFDFTGNTESFDSINTEFCFEIYEYVKDATQFRKEPVYQSEKFPWSGFSGTSALTQTINTSELRLDNDFLVKGHFKHDVCTEFMNRLGKTSNTLDDKSGDKFGLYNSMYDYFFVVINEAQTPQFELTGDKDNLGVFNVYSLEAEDGQTIYPAPNNVASGLMVALNGATLSEDYDYTFYPLDSGSTVEFVAPTVSGDMITYSYISNNESTNKVKIDVYDVDSAIVSGVTNGEGSETVYFNTDSGKNELFTSISPRNGDSIFVTLNGATLANGIDYYQSTTNPKRIILEGTILMGDIITIYYPVIPDASGNVNSLEYNVGWSIEDAPTLINGVFTVELGTDETFSTIVYSVETDYIIGQRNYESILAVEGNFGDEFYYRVKNEKNYESIKGDLISDIAYSDIIPITLNTNANNSY